MLINYLTIDAEKCTDAISVDKDVDGLTVLNTGKLVRGDVHQCLIPCTPLGCMELIRRTNIDINGKKAVIVGRSKIVVSANVIHYLLFEIINRVALWLSY